MTTTHNAVIKIGGNLVETQSFCTSCLGFPSFTLKYSNVMHTYHTQSLKSIFTGTLDY